MSVAGQFFKWLIASSTIYLRCLLHIYVYIYIIHHIYIYRYAIIYGHRHLDIGVDISETIIEHEQNCIVYLAYLTSLKRVTDVQLMSCEFQCKDARPLLPQRPGRIEMLLQLQSMVVARLWRTLCHFLSVQLPCKASKNNTSQLNIARHASFQTSHSTSHHTVLCTCLCANVSSSIFVLWIPVVALAV